MPTEISWKRKACGKINCVAVQPVCFCNFAVSGCGHCLHRQTGSAVHNLIWQDALLLLLALPLYICYVQLCNLAFVQLLESDQLQSVLYTQPWIDSSSSYGIAKTSNWDKHNLNQVYYYDSNIVCCKFCISTGNLSAIFRLIDIQTQSNLHLQLKLHRSVDLFVIATWLPSTSCERHTRSTWVNYHQNGHDDHRSTQGSISPSTLHDISTPLITYLCRNMGLTGHKTFDKQAS